MLLRRVGWISLIVAIPLGFVIGHHFWDRLNHVVMINKVGLLERAGVPFNQPDLFAGLGAILAGGLVVRHLIRVGNTSDAMRTLADEIQFQYLGNQQIAEVDRPRIPGLSGWLRIDHLISGTVDESPALFFDLERYHKRGQEKTTTRWTVILFRDTHLPNFSAIPNIKSTFLERMFRATLDFDPDVYDINSRDEICHFNSSYKIELLEALEDGPTPSSEEEVRNFLVLERMKILADFPNWHMSSADDCLMLAVKGYAPAERRSELWHQAVALRAKLVAPVQGGQIVPSRHGMNISRITYRKGRCKTGAIVGTLLGFFGSFFGAFGLVVMRLSQQNFGATEVALVVATPALIVVGIVLGGIFGFALGGKYADIASTE